MPVEADGRICWEIANLLLLGLWDLVQIKAGHRCYWPQGRSDISQQRDCILALVAEPPLLFYRDLTDHTA